MATRKVYKDNESELEIVSKTDGTFIFSINPIDYIRDTSYFELELTREDVIEMINDLQYYLDSQSKKTNV